ncbi:replication initiator protein A [Shuttleworthella satelles]|uniref:replication initiator protein A n=1 Tax=Shuttleworthella satelles TaxID=177972 RepID=UPI002ED0F053
MYDYFYGSQSDQFAFYRIPKVLFTAPRFKTLSTDAKALYGILLDRMNLSAKNGWIDKYGRVYIIFTTEEIMEAMGCANQKATRLLAELEKDIGLIERKRQGLGKSNLIYVKNFIAQGNPQESHVLNHGNHKVIILILVILR